MPDAGTPSVHAAPPGRVAGNAIKGHGPWLAALATAGSVLAVTAVAALLVRAHLLDAAQARFDARVARATADLHRELVACTQMMRGAGGLVAAQQLTSGEPPSADVWDHYTSRLGLDDTQPCLRTLAYAPLAGDAQSAAAPFVSLAPPLLTWPQRRDAASAPWPGISAGEREALMRAADTAEVALAISGAPVGGPSPAAGSRVSAEAYFPVYRLSPAPTQTAQRRAALMGFVIAQLDTDYLFASVAARSPHMQLAVATASPPLTLYPPAPTPVALEAPAPDFRRAEALHFGGQTLALRYATSDRALVAPTDFGVIALLVSGTIAAIVAAAGAYLLMRRRGHTLAEAGVARSRSTLYEARMAAIVRASSEAIITIDDAQRIVIFNPMAEDIFRCRAEDAIGQPIDRFIPERFRDAHRSHVQQFGATGISQRQMGNQRVLVGLRADGEEFPVEASISQVTDPEGHKLYTVMLRDVTARVRAENELQASREALRKLSANLQSVREEEKTRIARELHDDLGQQLTALKMDLSSVWQSLETVPNVHPSVGPRLQSMRRLIDTTVHSVRRIAADLRPVMLDDLGLMPALEWLLNDFKTRYGIQVDREIELGAVEFSRDGATALFRIVQEALTNVVRHAQASRVTVAAKIIEGDRCMLRIADDGRGAGSAQIEERGEKSFGLLGIRERAHLFGGSVSIETAASHGFVLTVVLPLAAIQQEKALP